uniref:Delta(24(24(1)))-sterol reductase n=1 Tax=Odontella aurita TaxID=265563 RepID=A0A7S4HX25_9STRA|mmetsp:Transcript_16511/g.47504  ORF Transcript_16511/g.47504 Transcript_16511/m.47504 type:complete len:604 (+) Transcript_16511:491-2302(+)
MPPSNSGASSDGGRSGGGVAPSAVRRRRIVPAGAYTDDPPVPPSTAASSPSSSAPPSPSPSVTKELPCSLEDDDDDDRFCFQPAARSPSSSSSSSSFAPGGGADGPAREDEGGSASGVSGGSDNKGEGKGKGGGGIDRGVNKKDIEMDSRIVWEFGGPVGVSFLMAFFPALMCYMYVCLLRHSGKLVNPFDAEFWRDGLPCVAPTPYAAKLYLGFAMFQVLTASTFPGVMVKGLPIPSLGGKQLEYNCNGVATWYFDLAVVAAVHFGGAFDLADIIDNVGPIMSVAILTAFVVTILTYAVAVTKGNTHRMSGSHPYDMFMGAILNPRLGNLDLKMFAEIRIPWKVLFLISLSAAVKDHRTNAATAAARGLPDSWDALGLSLPIVRTSAPLLFMLLAHTLYVNACMKGEECIPTTWDIFYEKWGYMLIYWNLAGVPFSYCYSTIYLSRRASDGNPVSHSPGCTAALFVALLCAYYVWDTANSQKNRFRMQGRGTYVERRTFPQLPFGTLENPTYIQTRHGNKLLTGGWWGVARKIHYTADLVMALCWGLNTGFGSVVPYFYFVFFTTVLTHRVSRDMEHCRDKYGKDWERYTREVPYIFIPYVF